VTRCVHCLADLSEPTWDHAPPKSWYPAATLQNVTKPKAPSCRECNSRLGRLEKRLFERMGMCLDPNHPLTARPARRAARAVNPAAAFKRGGRRSADETWRDLRRRLAARDGLVRDLIPAEDASVTLPGFGPHPQASRKAVHVASKDLESFGEKMVRVSLWYFCQKHLEEGQHVEVFAAIDPAGLSGLRPGDFAEAKSHDLAPGMRTAFVFVPEDPGQQLWEFELWARWFVFAFVLPFST